MSLGEQDPRLTPFFAADTEQEAQHALGALFDSATEQVLAEAVRRGLFGSARRSGDADDVVSETRVRLIRRLWSLRHDGGDAIEDFGAYVAATATRTCYAYLRARFPARTRFRNQVRYSVSRHPETRLDADSNGVWHCQTRLAVRAVPTPGAARDFVAGPASFLSRAGIGLSSPLPTVIARLLSLLDEPIELDRLVDALATAFGVVDPVMQPHAGDNSPVERLPDPAPDAARELTNREALESLWREITELPLNQRIALLLNLRDPDGGSAVHALPATGLVTMAGIAAALELEPSTLDELWDRLPLDDHTIAARLGLTRQQVINLRKSARARLARRTVRERS